MEQARRRLCVQPDLAMVEAQMKSFPDKMYIHQELLKKRDVTITRDEAGQEIIVLDTSYASKEPSERFDRRREFRFPWSHSRTSRRCRSQAAAIQARPQVRSPFSEKKKATEDVWFTENPLGKNSICEMMQRILQKAGLSKTYTNHSVRATCFTRLAEFGVDGHIIMATPGNRSVQGPLKSNCAEQQPSSHVQPDKHQS